MTNKCLLLVKSQISSISFWYTYEISTFTTWYQGRNQRGDGGRPPDKNVPVDFVYIFSTMDGSPGKNSWLRPCLICTSRWKFKIFCKLLLRKWHKFYLQYSTYQCWIPGWIWKKYIVTLINYCSSTGVIFFESFSIIDIIHYKLYFVEE